MIPREDIDAVRQAADIASVVRDNGVELRSVGTKLIGLCPFHNERSPSFNINPSSNTYMCFGCQNGGDIFTFVQEIDSLTFVESVRVLAEKFNVTLHETDSGSDENESLKKRLLSCVNEAAMWMRKNFMELPDSHLAKEELRKRNLYEVDGKPQWLQDFGIGYAPDGWSHLCDYLRTKNYSEEEILSSGLASRSEKSRRITDRFRGRLTWEIRDVQGRTIGFGARKLFDTDNGPKYLNSPESLIYNKSQVLYGLDMARKSISKLKEVNIVEGYTDVMANVAAGIENTVASSGTAFTEEHTAVIRRLIDNYDGKGQGKFIFSFDTDAAGQKAAKKTFSLKSPIHSRSYVAGNGNASKDPCELRLEKGDDALRSFMETRIPLTEFVLREEKKNHDTSVAEGRSSFLLVAASILSVITDNMLREDYARRIAFMGGSNYDSVVEAIRSAPRYDPYPTEDSSGSKKNYTDSTSEEPGNDEYEPYDNYDDEGYSPDDDPFGEVEPVMVETKSKLWDQESILLAALVQYPTQTLIGIKDNKVSEKDFPDTSLRIIFTEATLLLEAGIEKIHPHDFSDPELALDLFHQRLSVLDRFSHLPKAEELISRTVARFAHALKEIPAHDKRVNLTAQIAESFSDSNTEDEVALQEILDAQKQVRRMRKKPTIGKI